MARLIYNKEKLGVKVPQITVLSAWDQNMDSLAEVVIPNREAYCKKHGYKHETGTDFHRFHRHGCWWKVPMLQQSTTPWSVWMDLDILITNPEIKLESFIQTDADLIFSYDVNGANVGVIFCRQSDWSGMFLQRWWDEGYRYKDYPSPEQASLAYLLYKEPKSKWECRSQKEFNTYDYAHYNYGPQPEGQHVGGSFVLHLPALPNSLRIQRFKDILNG